MLYQCPDRHCWCTPIFVLLCVTMKNNRIFALSLSHYKMLEIQPYGFICCLATQQQPVPKTILKNGKSFLSLKYLDLGNQKRFPESFFDYFGGRIAVRIWGFEWIQRWYGHAICHLVFDMYHLYYQFGRFCPPIHLQTAQPFGKTRVEQNCLPFNGGQFNQRTVYPPFYVATELLLPYEQD